METVLKTGLFALVLFVLWTVVVESRKDFQVEEEIRRDGIRKYREEEVTIEYSLGSFKLCLKNQTSQTKASLETQYCL